MRTIIIAATASLLATSAFAASHTDAIKLGFLGGITGPIESLMPPIQGGAQLAVDEVNGAGGIGEGSMIELFVTDTTCVDATAAANAGDRAVNVEEVTAIVGGMCSGATIAIANNAAIPSDTVMVSPASTSPALTTLDDNDLVFRTAPSDAFQGEVLAQAVLDRDINEVAVTYVNNDYGKGFAESFETAFTAGGGTVTLSEAHEDGKADYRPEIGNLASSGATNLVVLAYVDGSGGTIVQQAVEAGDFDQFIGGDGMVGAAIGERVGAAADGMIATRPGSPDNPGADTFRAAAEGVDLDPDATFAAQSYDAAMLLALAMEKTGGEKEGLGAALREVATAPGEPILPGEFTKAKELIAAGTDIDYQGASGDHEFDEAGDVPGQFDVMIVRDGSFVVEKEM